jgi:methyl-accepting chemotaxis protein
MKISSRVMVLVGLMSALLMAIGGMGLFGISTSNAALRSVYEDRTVPTGQLGDIEMMILGNRLAIAVALVTPTPEVIASSVSTVEANIAQITKVWEAYMATKLTPEEAVMAQTFAEQRKQFVVEGLKPTVAALQANNLVEAQRLVVEKVRPLYVPVNKSVHDLIQLQLTEALKEYTQAEERYDTIRGVSIASMVLGILAAVVFGFMTVRTIGGQLGGEPAEATHVAKNVGAGDLSLPISLKVGDDSSLMAQLKTMQENLTQVVGKVRQGAESLAIASAEIAQGNQDLSSRTESQASSLEETAASMEQLGATVKQNADSARQANQLAMNASTVAIKGGEVVAQVVETMKGINDSSRRIADIISVIDGIAFQTNILALNAAVEAARAGEQGRGFAVVASEVRSLAGRSADAAKEIKTLINASVERVEHGTNLVDQAGTTMSEVVSSIRRVTDLMGEISAASTEQSLGVSQVGEAVSQMDQVTQQNAALVEEMAAAASSLKAQAQDLVQVVSVFNLGTAQAGATMRSTALHLSAPGSGAMHKAPIYRPAPAKWTPAPARTRPVAALPKPAAKAAPKPVQAASASSDEEWETF